MRQLSAFQPLSLEHVDLGGGRRVRVVQRLGKGSVSAVYRCVLESPYGVEKAVALKVFDSVASDEAEHVFRLLRDTAARGACVRHPNVVEIHEVGFLRQQAYFVEELVDGVGLHALLERWATRGRRMPLDLALFIATEVAEGLNGARVAKGPEGMQLGVLHGGLTPRDILLSWRGEVKVSDFEISTARAASSSVRSLSSVASRAATMAPEVAQGLPGDARADVFALGVILREMIVGPRFPGGVTNAQALELARDGYVHPIALGPHLPHELQYILGRALALDPADRYPNASRLAYDLQRVTLSMGVGDGRWFLRRALDHEWGNDACEVTAERPFATPSQAVGVVDDYLGDEDIDGPLSR
jgi:serine/threonine-protein kinase